MSDMKRSIWEWSRCAEGFSDLTSDNEKDGKRKSESVKRKSGESDFSHGNIFEKLALGMEEDKSQDIAWSSSDDEKKKEDKKEIITPVAKKPRRKATPKSSAPSRRSSRASARIQNKSVTEVVEITDCDDFVPTSQPSQDASCSVKSEDAAIQIFDSDSENVDSSCKSVIEKQTDAAEDSQVSISGVNSQSSTSPVPQTGTGLKGSDWLKSLQLKTPSKSDVPGESLDPDDSARKKKKHSKGGLADQLSKIQLRDKSAVRMWSHQLGKPSASQDSKSIQLEVIGFDKLYSLQLVKCVHVDGIQSQLSLKANVGQSGADKSGVTGEGSDIKTAAVESKLVMFPVSQAEQLNLEIGSRFKIFPPWQQLELNDGQHILLCTKYCHVIEQTGDVLKQGPSVAMETVTTKARWNCPCVQGLCRCETLCPAYLSPSMPGLIQEKTLSSPQGKDSNSNLLKSSEKSVVSHLQTISTTTSQSHDLRSESTTLLQDSTTCNSILKSIEACKDDTDGVSGSSCSVSFPAHIHRAITVKDHKGSTSCVMLVEDYLGTVCELCLSLPLLSKCDVDINNCENKSFLFAGLTVKERVIREKNEQLFSMIDHVWSGKSALESQETLESQDMFGITGEPPGFCYVLHVNDYSTLTMKPCTRSILPPASPQSYSNLREILKSGEDKRISCVVKLLLIHTKKSSRILYVTCNCMDDKQQYYQIQRDSLYDTSEKTSDPIILIRDLFVCKGELIADQYSQILSASKVDKTDEVLKEEMNKLCSVQCDIRELWSGAADGDLCSVKGVISEVDEDSAYSWEECTHCGSDQLQSQSSQGFIQCIACKKTMSEGIQKLKMEVMINCTQSDIQAKVDLLQSTIQCLLPEDEGDEDGYELSSVLNKDVGPLYCVVISSSDASFLLREISLLK